ncbi:MAG: adenylate kinase [Planctomycetes bacterium]|nr:adenylate kinase [Planctomycetota bacterium]
MAALTRLLLVGPPGVGKGTQAKRIADSLRVPHISTGDILRDAVKRATPVGLKAKEFMDSGGLVPDEVMIGIIEERFAAGDCAKGYILDGFPRTTPQAEALERLLERLKLPIEAAIQLDCSDAVVVERITGRRSCSNKACQATYHVEFLPPKNAGKCDRCSSPLEQRTDDALDAVKKRLEKFHRETSRILPYYEARKLLLVVDGKGTPDQVFAGIRRIAGF